MDLIETPGEHEMTTCSQHGAFEKNMERRLDEIHEDIRTLTLHLIPPAQKPSTTGGGIHVAVNASGANTTTTDTRSSATEPAKPDAKSETQWTRIISLCLVIVIIGMEAGPPALAAIARMFP